ncbi:amidase signature domain-containing protein [Microdochium trichocladiopsis]|uniref:Amidase signature domain-containing protein n=1 Tax=Microdochium trichocladiopsis TaxID=1682393 RepID=A0A9P8Y305_9PEZI|nr:amidase signature domain-containing protein [Microdochium trichocladiopsis]KAH7028156.1 amidase signature domain-containing protein [Microdochium trichocladiopsis]
MGSVETTAPLSIVEASVQDLASALSSGYTNSVELTAKHLLRIAKYDRRGAHLNAVPIINQNVFDLAQASDERRVQGKTLGPLDGIPCTIKDSYKIQGMTVASGSPAFQNLVANEDAFTVQMIREAGGVMLGRTNMPPMAAGGMQRGVYGRAESPYNPNYLTAAFASGSSNGSATATAASFGVFGMGEETISSGRSPASNNGLVAYTPSRGVISIRGNWPLFPTCDVVVPHTRTVEDMFALLDVIVAKDDNKTGDFWRGQPYVELPSVESVRPQTYQSLRDTSALSGKKIGVPKMYIGGVDSDPAARRVHTRQSIIDLWLQARKVLESLGATVEEIDLPVVTKFEKPDEDGDDDVSKASEGGVAPPHRNDVDMCQLMAYAWDDFLAATNDGNVATSLAQIDSATIFPQPPGTIPDKYDAQDPLVRHYDVKNHIVARHDADSSSSGAPRNIYDLPNMEKALKGLEARRKEDWDDWLATTGLDAVVWPCNGDVGRADADTSEDSSADAWRNGVLYSNGNCAIRQLGIPTVSTTMGCMADTGHAGEPDLRGQGVRRQQPAQRKAPGLTPELATDRIEVSRPVSKMSGAAPRLEVVQATAGTSGSVVVSGKADKGELRSLKVYINGEETGGELEVAKDGSWHVQASVPTGQATSGAMMRAGEINVPSREQSMVVVLASGVNAGSRKYDKRMRYVQ